MNTSIRWMDEPPEAVSPRTSPDSSSVLGSFTSDPLGCSRILIRIRNHLRSLGRAAAVRLLFNGEARVRGGAARADAALLRALRAPERTNQRALVAEMSKVVAIVAAERQRRVRRAQSRRRGGGKGEAVLLWERAPLPLLLLVHKAREHIDSPPLPPLGPEVARHDPAEKNCVEAQNCQ